MTIFLLAREFPSRYRAGRSPFKVRQVIHISDMAEISVIMPLLTVNTGWLKIQRERQASLKGGVGFISCAIFFAESKEIGLSGKADITRA